MDHATIDFESRSEVDLRKTGAWRYAEDPSTEVKMMCYALGDGKVDDWIGPTLEEAGIPSKGEPTKLFDHIENGGIVEAHSAFFERSIWRNKMVKVFGWPDIPDNQWRCSAAKAAAHSLPRGLDDAVKALRLDPKYQKDKEGHKLMLRLCKPRPAWLKNGQGPKYFGTKEELLRELAYCRQDVVAERALSKNLKELPDHEWKIWMIDQAINERGIYCDREMATKIIEMMEVFRETMLERLQALTSGEIERPTKRKQVLEWMWSQDIPIENTQAATLRQVSEDYDGENVADVARICVSLNKSSVSKYKAMLARASESDGRIRDTLMYHGAGTGRWSGKGVQFQNIAKGKIKKMEKTVDRVLHSQIHALIIEYGDDLMSLFSGLVRGAVAAPPGRRLRVADYSSIEARGVMWLAGDKAALGVFERGQDIYCDMASDIYGQPILKEKTDSEKPGYDPFHAQARQLGKQAILGLGFSMGPKKFLSTCEGYQIHFMNSLVDQIVPKIEQERIEKDIRKQPIMFFDRGKVDKSRIHPLILSKYIVERYREKYLPVVEYWKDCEDAAKEAIFDHIYKRPRKWVRAGARRKYGNVYYRVHGKFLFCLLPSRRFLAYPFPSIRKKKMPWGDEKDTICYKGVDSFTRQWTWQYTYGGKLVENITQGSARDLMAYAMTTVDAHPDYDLVMSVHDELITETEDYAGSTEELEDLMRIKPSWATGFPLDAEGWSGYRYRK